MKLKQNSFKKRLKPTWSNLSNPDMGHEAELYHKRQTGKNCNVKFPTNQNNYE